MDLVVERLVMQEMVEILILLAEVIPEKAVEVVAEVTARIQMDRVVE
jgi:hypothetical protein